MRREGTKLDQEIGWVANALMNSHILCKISSFSVNPRHRKSIQQIGPRLVGTVNRAVPFFKIGIQLTNIFVAPSETVSLMLMRKILSLQRFSHTLA